MGVKLKDIGAVIGLVGQAAPLVGGLFKKKKKAPLGVPTLDPETTDFYRNVSLRQIAAEAAENAAKNASRPGATVAPQLLIGDIIFVLVDAAKAGKILFPQDNEVKE